MHIHLSSTDGVPIYLQIVQQVKHLLASGRLAAGEELPPIRALAERLLVNPNTVARAYRELEREGLVTKRSTTGTFVSDSAAPLARRQRVQRLLPRIDALIAEARQMGFSLAELIELVSERDRKLSPTEEV